MRHRAELGLLEQIRFDGRRRFVRIVPTAQAPQAEGGKTPPSEGGKTPPHNNSSKLKTALPDSVSGGVCVDGGFGLVTPEDTNTTDFDKEIATILEQAVRTYKKPRKTGVTNARPSTWANHIRLLRTRDAIPEIDIRQVMEWYVAHMGEEYVPEVYSGEAFRRKFAAIESRVGRDLVGNVVVGQDAQGIAMRLTAIGWPAGCREHIPAATQVCLAAYTEWFVKRDAFITKLSQDNFTFDRVAEWARHLKLGRHLQQTMPSATHFVQQWMEGVYARVKGWDGWNGDFTPLLFHSGAKKFRRMGRAWAEKYANDPDRWDRFCEVMQDESK